MCVCVRVRLFICVHMDDITVLVMWSWFNKPDLPGRELSTAGLSDHIVHLGSLVLIDTRNAVPVCYCLPDLH